MFRPYGCGAGTCRWLLYNKITFLHGGVFVGLFKNMHRLMQEHGTYKADQFCFFFLCVQNSLTAPSSVPQQHCSPLCYSISLSVSLVSRTLSRRERASNHRRTVLDPYSIPAAQDAGHQPTPLLL